MLCNVGMEAGTEVISSNAGAACPIMLAGRELALAGLFTVSSMLPVRTILRLVEAVGAGDAVLADFISVAAGALSDRDFLEPVADGS